MSETMVTTDGPTAAERYAARVDAVLAQRTRLRGPQPIGDLFAQIPPDHPMMRSDPRRPLDQNLAAIASYIEPSDRIVDVGGGSGRVSLPLALRCREVIVVEPSFAMVAGLAANADRAGGIANVRVIKADWLAADSPTGTVALVNHVTYFARDIGPFLEKLERVGRRRVIITVNDPPPPSWSRRLFQLVYGEDEVAVPGQAELVNVLWERGLLPDVRVLPAPLPTGPTVSPNREAAIAAAAVRFNGEQWARWPLELQLERRLRETLETRFEDLFAPVGEGYFPRYITPGREVLITWRPGEDRLAK